MRVAGLDIDDARPIPAGDICQAWQGTVSGRSVFAKTLRDPPPGFFAAEARGLALIAVAGGPPVPGVVGVGDDGLVLDWVEPGAPTRAIAEIFGHRLATMHATVLPDFGGSADGFIGSLPLPNATRPSWSRFYVEQRILPYVAALSNVERRAIERVCESIDEIAGPPEPPARIHGDLWSGNLLWGADGAAWLVDAAGAHGGHRETDLAMLQLFGAPHLEVILSAYQEISPLADGWQHRVQLHQLHPLLVHTTLFGGGYGARAAAAAASAIGGG